MSQHMWLKLLDQKISFVAIVVLSGITASTVTVNVQCLGAMLISPLLSQGTHRIACLMELCSPDPPSRREKQHFLY